MGVWKWLNCNSAAVQSLAALGSFALTFVTILVLIITWRAVKRQAAAAKEQAEAARAQIEASLAPLLVAEPGSSGVVGDFQLVNRGPGVAFKVFFWLGGLDVRSQEPQFFAVQPSTVGPGNSVPVRIAGRPWEAFTVHYKGVDRASRWTVVYRDPTKPQEYVVSKGLQEVYLS